MPPRQKISHVPDVAPQDGLLKIGALVNLVSGGRTLTDYEVLDFDSNFVKFRGNIQVAPQTEIVLIPWAQIEALGLRGER
jgi:hypothetical protein